jgi:hypothetical protein
LVEYNLAGSSYLRFYLAPKASYWHLISDIRSNGPCRSAMTNRRDNGGILIHDGTRLEHISCGVKVDFKDMDELLLVNMHWGS